MKPHPFLLTANLAVFALTASLAPAANPAAKIEFSDKGLSSLQIGSEELLANGLPAVSRLVGADGKPMPSKPAGASFDAASKTQTVRYDWGTLTCQYEPLPDGLRMNVTVENSGTQTLTALTANLLSLRSLGEGKNRNPIVSVEVPAFVFFKGSLGTAIFGVEDQKFPLSLDFGHDKKTDTHQARGGFGGGKVVLDGVQMSESLAPGQKFDFRFILRVGPAGSDPMALGADFLESFRKANPAVLKWPDRRPIFRAFFGGGLPKEQAVANLKNPESVVPPILDEKFRDNLLKKMGGVIEAAKVADAQGVILWDMEGETFPHAITYIGDPRLIRLLNPQMDLVADEAIKKLRDAGLKVGITLRPSRVIYDAEKNSARHTHTGVEPFPELDAKIAYAIKRWGCAIFYVDTNFFWQPYGPEKKWQSGPLSTDIWRKLLAKYPDILFIPEFAFTGDYANVAGYGEADMGNYGVPDMAKALYPDAFRVIVIEDADPAENFDRFAGALAAGNSLMTYGQGKTNLNAVMVKRLHDEVAFEKAGVPAQVAAASPEELIKLLSDKEAGVRFHTARRLAATPEPAAAARLLEMVQAEDEAWTVRRAAVVALGKFSYPPAIPALFGLLDDRAIGLYADAARALAGQDASVEELAVEKIRAASAVKGRSNVYDQTGAVLVLRKALGRAPTLQEVFTQMPESETQNRRALLALIGELRNPESEAFLLPLLSRPEYAPVAAAALVRIGSVAGVEQVNAAVKAASDAGDKDLADSFRRALQAR